MNRKLNLPRWEVAVIGGGSAGLSAALTLARARRSVIVIDAGTPRNAPATAAHGLLGREGINPLEFLARGLEEVSSYGAGIIHAKVLDVETPANEGFILHMDDATVVHADQLVLATGVRDELPDIPGLAARWGRDVVHCPYCHGWEIRDKRIGLLATGEMSAMQALMFHQWSEQVWFFPGHFRFPPNQLETLAAVGVTVVPETVTGIDVTDDRLTGIVISDGSQIGLDALAVPSLTRARLDGLQQLGLNITDNEMGTAVEVDTAGHTSVPGVWAAGNLANPTMQVSEASANGARVAMTLNTELIFAEASRILAETSSTADAPKQREQ